MALLGRLASYYVRNALPFATGVAFALATLRVDYPWYVLAAAGAVLVVAGPLTIQFALTLIVQALRGMPDETTAGAAAPRGGGARLAQLGGRGRARGR
jgi:hypothetical protein